MPSTTQAQLEILYLYNISFTVYNVQGRIYYEANEAKESSALSPHHLGGPHQNFNAVSKVDIIIALKIFKR